MLVMVPSSGLGLVWAGRGGWTGKMKRGTWEPYTHCTRELVVTSRRKCRVFEVS